MVESGKIVGRSDFLIALFYVHEQQYYTSQIWVVTIVYLLFLFLLKEKFSVNFR